MVRTHVWISMGHRLRDYTGDCKFLHGHNYKVEVALAGELDARGFVIDFRHLKAVLKDILRQFDHAVCLRWDDPLVEHLRAEKYVLLNVNPTAEALAQLWYMLLAKSAIVEQSRLLLKVEVWETETGVAACSSYHEDVVIYASNTGEI